MDAYLGDGRLLRLQNDLGLVRIDVESTEDQDQARERRVRGDGLEPVVVQVEQALQHESHGHVSGFYES